MSPSVAFVQRRVPHYREAFFAGLHENLAARGISLDVMVADPAAAVPERGPSRLSAIGCRRLALGGRQVIWQNSVGATSGHDLVITELSPRIVSNLALIARSRRGGPKVGGFGHGRNFASTHVPSPRSAHGRLVRSLDWWFAYNDLSREAITALGFPPARITAVNNTIDTKLLGDAVAAHRAAGVDELRRTLGIDGAPVAIFCGTLDPRKRLDFVFDAALRLRERFPGLELLVLGDGPGERDVRAFAAAHDWVHYPGRVVGVERAQYLAVADVMLMPGLVGLVVLDSFASAVPMVTTDWPFHSPEIQYLEHGENGWRSANTLDAYVDAVGRLLSDDALRAHLRRGCDEATARYPMEGMVTRFADGIVAALKT
ncbi:MAG TPA: glycosyltransferase family 4 protein [Solirubrobacteraceae bacterium]|nr:glycosyltransferase family 4 protein [Solirubrobacteraceae bacterium]